MSRVDLIEKVVFEQKFEEGEGVSLWLSEEECSRQRLQPVWRPWGLCPMEESRNSVRLKQSKWGLEEYEVREVIVGVEGMSSSGRASCHCEDFGFMLNRMRSCCKVLISERDLIWVAFESLWPLCSEKVGKRWKWRRLLGGYCSHLEERRWWFESGW